MLVITIVKAVTLFRSTFLLIIVLDEGGHSLMSTCLLQNHQQSVRILLAIQWFGGLCTACRFDLHCLEYRLECCTYVCGVQNAPWLCPSLVLFTLVELREELSEICWASWEICPINFPSWHLEPTPVLLCLLFMLR